MNGDNEDDVTIDEGDPDPSETLRILVATDNHLGFGEKYPERQNDSYIGKNYIFFLSNYPGTTFIQEATFIPDSRVGLIVTHPVPSEYGSAFAC